MGRLNNSPRMQPTLVYARESNAPTVCEDEQTSPLTRLEPTHIVDQSNTPHVEMFTVECILKELDYIIANGILSREAFRPCQDFSSVQSSLLDRETESKAKGDCGLFRHCGGGEWVSLFSRRGRWDRRCEISQESIDRVCQVVCVLHVSGS